MTEIVRDERHNGGVPTIGETGIRVINVASAYEHSGYSPDEIADLYYHSHSRTAILRLRITTPISTTSVTSQLGMAGTRARRRDLRRRKRVDARRQRTSPSGLGCATAVEEEIPGYRDSEHLRYAADRNWPLLTLDDDFPSLIDS